MGASPLAGRKPGDRRVRIDRPQSEFFRFSGPGMLIAREAAHVEPRPLGVAWARIRRVLVGRPLATYEEIGERLSKAKALAIFSSDAISSSAYASEEILRALLLGGVALAAFSLPIAVAIAVLLGVVAFSYRQVCLAYPNGGGSYSVSMANFGRLPSLVAASALLIDYTMTVAVSISSASQQIISAVPALDPDQVAIAVGAIILITLGNLRGVRESGNIFALPTYLFVGSALLMIVLGGYRLIVLGEGTGTPSLAQAAQGLSGGALVVIVLHAFASGAVALTGTEAIATGVPAFKPPEPRNAARTLAVMAILLAVLFIGITFLAERFGALPDPHQTVIAQVASRVYGAASPGFYFFQAITALLLFLAANTSFAAFPRLAAVLALDGFFPRAFSFRGDRLAFTMGIVVLGVVAACIVTLFGADTNALIPLYAVGVFIDFTISQAGMVRHWLRTRPAGWRRRLPINAVGCVVTGIVFVVVVLAKAPTSLVVIGLIPAFVAVMLFVRREYDQFTRELAVRPDLRMGPPHRRDRVVIPVAGITRAVVQAVQFGRSLTEDVRAVHVTADLAAAAGLQAAWARHLPGVPLVIVESPYRSLVTPFLSYLNVVTPPDPDTVTIVVLPEYVPRHWWDLLLYNQTTNRLKRGLVGRPHTVVTMVPYRRDRSAGPSDDDRADRGPRTTAG